MNTLTLRKNRQDLEPKNKELSLTIEPDVQVGETNFISLIELFNERFRYQIPFKKASYSPIPEFLERPLRVFLAKSSPQLYDQATALYQLHKRKNVLLSTKTASGKSLVFMSFAINKLLKSPESRVLVLYPTRALIEDQLLRWCEISEQFGFKTALLHGQVQSENRVNVLENSHIVLCTPDIIHYWLMPNLYLPAVAKWISALDFIIIDEAHTFSGIFGTNVSYLLKRMESFTKNVQYFASTATISGANEFLTQLTQKEFVEVGLREDGSPTYKKEILFVAPEKQNDSISSLLAEVIASNRKFMYFKNSRQGIEVSLSHLLKGDYGDEILPQIKKGFVCTYRGGYESKDRKIIMRSLRLGVLKGVLCTSALEVGLDIGDVELVIIDGLSPNINSFWQRVGRAGRKGPSLVIQILPESSLVEPDSYAKSPLLKPVLYPQVEFFKDWHSRCAVQEQVIHKKRGAMAHKLQFKHSFRTAGVTFKLGLEVNQGLDLGDVDYEQYLNEAYPGAIYRYMGRPHRVGWRNKNFIKCFRTKDIRVHSQEIKFSLLDKEHIDDGFSCYLTRAQTVRAIIGFSQFDHGFFYNEHSTWCKKPIFKLYNSVALVVNVSPTYKPDAEIIHDLIQAFATEVGFDTGDVIYHLDDNNSRLIIQAIIPDTGLVEEILWPVKDVLLGLLSKLLNGQPEEGVKDTKYYLNSHQVDPLKVTMLRNMNFGFYVDVHDGKYLFLSYKGVDERGYYEICTDIGSVRFINPYYFYPAYERPSAVVADLMLNGYGHFRSEENAAEPVGQNTHEIASTYDGTEHYLEHENTGFK